MIRQNYKLKVTGALKIFKNTPKGRVLVYEKDNLVVDSGLDLIADRMKANSSNFLDNIAVGTDATVAVIGDTALGAEIERNVVTNATATLNVLVIETVFLDGEANATWREIALFNASVLGAMFNRIIINFDKTAADSVTVQFTLTFTRA